MDKIFKITPVVFMLFGLSVCLSEPLSRKILRILILLFLVMLWRKKFSLGDFVPYRKISLLMAAFITWLGISYIWGGMTIPLTHSSIEWILFSHNMFIFLLIGLMIREEKILTGIMLTLALSLIIDNVHIFRQAAQGIERPLTFLYGSVMQSTMLYIILLPPLLVMALRDNVDFRLKIFEWIIFLTSLAACIMINTRGAWLDLAIVLPFILFCRFKSRKNFLTAIMVSVVIGGIFVAVSPATFQRLQTVTSVGSEQSVTERFLMWRSALNMIADNPLTGVGFGNYETEYKEHYILDEAKERFQWHAHNVYLQFWAETGLPGIILFCSVFGYILFWSWRHVEKIYGLMLFTSTLDLMLYGLTDYTFASFSAMRVYWLFFGVCVAGIKLSERKNFSI